MAKLAYQPIRTSADLSSDALKTHRQPPPPDLAPYISDLWEFKVDAKHDYVPIQVFPSGCVVIRFNIKPSTVEAILYGPSINNNMKGLLYHEWTVFGAAFYPERAYHLLGLSLDEIRDLRINLECFWPQLIKDVNEQMWEATSFDERVIVLSNFLRKILREKMQPSATFLNAFNDLVSNSVHAKDIGLIAARHQSNGRTLRRQFSRYLGLGPKQMERVLRVQQSMRHMLNSPSSSLADISGACGFSDQAHFTREFRSILGHSPKQFTSLIGQLEDKSLPIWHGLDASWRYRTASLSITRFE